LLAERAFARLEAAHWARTLRRPLTTGVVIMAATTTILVVLPTVFIFWPWVSYADKAVLLPQIGLVGLSILGAALHRSRWPLYLTPWLSLAPYTLAWKFAWPDLPVTYYALIWLSLALLFLAAGFALDREARVRYAHGLYAGGYALAAIAAIWSFADREVNVMVLPVIIGLAAISQLLAHWQQHHSFEDCVQFLGLKWAMQVVFLYVAAYTFPIWVVQMTAWGGRPVAWGGLALALVAPLFIATGLFLRRIQARYAWPFYSAGYALTLISPALAFDDRLLGIVVLALNVAIFAASAYIFRESLWLYLSNSLLPVVALLALDYGLGHLPYAWVAGLFVGLAFMNFGLGWWLNRGQKGIGLFAWPCYLATYTLSWLALAAAVYSGDKITVIATFWPIVGLYALSAWLFRKTAFLYLTAILATIPYYLSVTILLPAAEWHGLALMPLVAGYVILGRLGFQTRAPGLISPEHPAMPFYLTAYALSGAAIVIALGSALALTLTAGAAMAVYFISAWVFRRQVWLYPGLLAAHITYIAFFGINPSGNPFYYIALPLLALTWLLALTGLLLNDFAPIPVAGKTEDSRHEIDFGAFPALRYLTTPSWAQPFFMFVAFDIAVGQLLGMGEAWLAFTIALGHMFLLALLATLWRDRSLAYGTMAFAALALGAKVWELALPFPQSMVWFGGFGFGLYWLVVLMEQVTLRVQPVSNRLVLWLQPLMGSAIALVSIAALANLPFLFSHTGAAATTLAFAGGLFMTRSYLKRHLPLGYLGMALLQIAWIMLLISRDVTHPQLYAVPAGLYFMVIGYLERRSHKTYAVLVESFGVIVLLLTTYIQSTSLENGSPFFLLLLLEALAVAWGAALLRLKLPFFIGLGASLLNLLTQLALLIRHVGDISPWLVFLGVGLFLVLLVAFLERQREMIIKQSRVWAEALTAWE
jgi:hypothetical protein